MTWTAGQKADATIVVNLVRDRYSNPAKDAVRTWVTQGLAAVKPTLVLDLWGGGASADEMTAAGLSVLSIDDGRSFAEYGVSKARTKRALSIKAEVGGYRAGWGSATTFAPECDAAWLDLMGHLCPSTIRALRACRGMKALAVTLMGERMKGAEDWTPETWTVVYRAAISHYSDLSVRSVRKYRRGAGWVLVFLARGLNVRAARQAKRDNNPEYREREREVSRRYMADPEHRARARALQKERLADPECRAKRAAWMRDWYANNPEYRERQRAKQHQRMADPEYRDRQYARQREKYATDPEYRARRKETDAKYKARANARRRELCATDPEYRARRSAENQKWRAAHPESIARRRERLADPEYRAKENALRREKYATDPEYRAKVNVRTREYQRNRAAAKRNSS